MTNNAPQKPKSSFVIMILANIVAYVIIGTVLFFIVLGIISSLSLGEKKVAVTNKSILQLNISGAIVERKPKMDFKLEGIGVEEFFGGSQKVQGLNDILYAIQKAEKDDKIKGIYIKYAPVTAGYATLTTIRKALEDFKKSGKFIYAYGNTLTEKGFFVASVADSIFLYPEGYVEWNGIGTTQLFYRKLLDKLGITPIELRMGKYKSAAESFAYDKMSEASKEQYSELLNGIWEYVTQKISESRNIPVEVLQKTADSLEISLPEHALKYKFVDALKYPDQIRKLLKEKSKVEKKLRLVSTEKFAKYARAEAKKHKNKIAVIYAVGPINMGEGDYKKIGSTTLAKAIRKAREDKNIKAVVLRVNSPGGSALASDIIAREIELLKKEKPVIASYGDVAASGGYYISALSDKIYAEPTTITGSIGVIGLLFNFTRLTKEKLGINAETVKTNPYADMGNTLRPMTEYEKQKMMSLLHDIYGDFIAVVMKGRGFKDSVAVDSIGQGRVWLGKYAKNINLIDGFASIQEVIKIAADKAGIEKYSIVELPKFKDPIQKALDDFLQTRTDNIIQRYLKQFVAEFNDPRGIYMRELVPEIE